MMNTRDKKNSEETEYIQEQSGTRRRIKLGTILVLSFLVIYIPSFFHWALGENIRTDIIRMGELEESVSTDAWFIRNEQVIKSPFDGRCITEVAEGDKVASRHRIAMIINPSYEKLVEKLNALDTDILKRQKELNEKENFFSQDIIKLDDEIAEKLALVIGECTGTSLVKARSYRESIDWLIERKASITGASGKKDPELIGKKAERKDLQDRINSNRQEILADKPGIISYMIDGYESKLRPGNITNLTPGQLSVVKGSEAGRKPVVSSVKAGKPFAKVINDIEYSIVVTLDSNEAAGFKVDMPVKVRIGETGQLLEGTVDYKSEEMEGKYVVSVTVDQGLSETAKYRKTNIDLIRKAYSGLKVPLKSLFDMDEEGDSAALVVVDANYAEFVRVNILGKDNEFAIIRNIGKEEGFDASKSADLYDTFVINPDNIKEGQLIE